LDLDLGPGRVGPGPLQHARALHARHHALKIEDRREAVVDRARRRERVLELNCHAGLRVERVIRSARDYRLRPAWRFPRAATRSGRTTRAWQCTPSAPAPPPRPATTC